MQEERVRNFLTDDLLMTVNRVCTSCLLLALIPAVSVLSSSLDEHVRSGPPIYLKRPHGVPLVKRFFYDPDKKEFTCLDGSQRIPFDWVNDDYCDCHDGTDEPGTAACSERGLFHCINLGHVSKDIPSSRVNDGVCDCCDGTDEYTDFIQCTDTCLQLGASARVEAARLAAVAKEGHQKRVNYAQQGSKTKEEKKKKLEELLKLKADIEPNRTDLETIKKQIEELETKAKDEHNQAWEQEKAARQAERDRHDGTIVFNAQFDYNKDSRLSIEEVRLLKQLDTDSDNEVSESEAMSWLGNRTEVDLDTFVREVYPRLRHLFPLEPPTPTGVPPQISSKEYVTPLPDDSTLRESKSKDGSLPADVSQPPPSKEEEMPEYSEETKLLIHEADKAREDFNDVDKRYKELDSQITNLQTFVNLDLGPSHEFAELVSKCFEANVTQYTYKLCVFDKTTQRSADGSGYETNLGYWGTWDDNPNVANKYLKQRYDKGTSCWNGPERSTEVRLTCGAENRLTGASEPAKCEYVFEFETPAVCEEPQLHPPHTEL